MQDVYMAEDRLQIREPDFIDPEDGALVADIHDVPLGAVAQWSEMLGYDNVVDTVEAIHRVARQGVQTQGVWDAPRLVLAHREEAREAEVLKAVEEYPAKDPRTPVLRGALAAYRALSQVSGSISPGESLLVKTQREARRRLGVPDPASTPSIQRGQRTMCDPTPADDPDAVLCGEDRARLSEVLAAACIPGECDDQAPRWLDLIQAKREAFCHSLTSNPVDPLIPAPVEVAAPLTLDTLRNQYREEAEDAA